MHMSAPAALSQAEQEGGESPDALAKDKGYVGVGPTKHLLE